MSASIGCYTYLNATRYLLARDIQTLTNEFIQFEVSKRWGFPESVEAGSKFLEEIRAKQFEDAKLTQNS